MLFPSSLGSLTRTLGGVLWPLCPPPPSGGKTWIGWGSPGVLTTFSMAGDIANLELASGTVRVSRNSSFSLVRNFVVGFGRRDRERFNMCAPFNVTHTGYRRRAKLAN